MRWVCGVSKGRHLDLNADMYARVRGQEEAREERKGWKEGSWPWMQTDRQGNQRQAVTFSAAGGSKALFKGLVNAGCCWGISLSAGRLITTVIQLSNPNPPPTHIHTQTHTYTGQDTLWTPQFYTVQARSWTEETTPSASANFTVKQTEYSTFLYVLSIVKLMLILSLICKTMVLNFYFLLWPLIQRLHNTHLYITYWHSEDGGGEAVKKRADSRLLR